MFSVYALHNSGRDKIYIGHSADLDTRMKRHNGLLPQKKSSFTTKNSGVWELVYREEFRTRKEAMKREKELKSSAGRKFIRSKIKKKDEG